MELPVIKKKRLTYRVALRDSLIVYKWELMSYIKCWLIIIFYVSYVYFSHDVYLFL